MIIQIISDLHIEFHRDKGNSLLQELVSSTKDLLVMAGDIGEGRKAGKDFLSLLLQNTSIPIIIVPGNHEYYHSSLEEGLKDYNLLAQKYSKLHVLNRDTVTIDGVEFAGCTMWYSLLDEADSFYFSNINDSNYIRDIRERVNEEAKLDEEFLAKNVQKDSIVITHLSPSSLSISSKYLGSNINRYFFKDKEKLIKKVQPNYWIHGHMHNYSSYKIGATNIICNPFGYPSEFDYQERYIVL